jgi:hypothetical protein
MVTLSENSGNLNTYMIFGSKFEVEKKYEILDPGNYNIFQHNLRIII